MGTKHGYLVLLVLAILLGCEQATTQPDETGDDVRAAKTSLSLGFASGDTSSTVTQDLTLPSLTANGVSVAWASDDTAITSTGKVTRPTAGNSDASVHLTATLTKGSVQETKTFTVIVKAVGATYTVTFDSQGGASVSPQVVADGGVVVRPTDPTKTGNSFDGWYQEIGCTNLWNFADTVTGPLTLYANWTPSPIKVSFQTGVGTTLSFSPSSVSIKLGDSFTVAPTTGLVGTDWTWLLDGVAISSQSTLTMTPTEVGFSTISLVFTSGPVVYSGTISLVVSP